MSDKDEYAPGCALVYLADAMQSLTLLGVTRYYYTAWDGTHRRWRYTDDERPSDARCYDCAVPYTAIGDCVVPDNVWEQINPTYHRGAGVLCANCILERMRVAGLKSVAAKLYAP